MASALRWACLPGTDSPPLPSRVAQMSGHLSAWGTGMGRAGVGRRAWGPGATRRWKPVLWQGPRGSGPNLGCVLEPPGQLNQADRGTYPKGVMQLVWGAPR